MRKGLGTIIMRIEAMSLDALRAEWKRRLGNSAPACRSKEVMRGLLAWALQAEALGGLTAETRSKLAQLGRRLQRSGRTADLPRSTLMPGAVLTRAWQGKLHKVYVLDGGYAYEGRQFASLSVIARAITGTRWSGPRFFGLHRGNGVREAQR